MRALGLAAVIAAGVLAIHGAAAAQPACASLQNPVYLQVGDTQNNLMKRLGRALRDDTAQPITLVWVTNGSCTNILAIENDTPVTVNMQYVPSIAEDPAWIPSSPTLPCTVPAPGGQIVDIANSALFNSACTADPPLPASIGGFQGPIQAYVMAVPEASAETAITMAEAYFTFGFGTAGMVTPWDDETEMYIRGPTKSTLLAWAANIQVPPNKWHGTVPQTPMPDSSGAVVAALLAAPMPAKAIGILGAEVYDARRADLDSLAYKAPGQYLAYYPDSTPNSLDKKNVRDGHYTVWSPTIWMTDVDNVGVPLDADAGRVIDLILGNEVTPAPANFTSIDVVANVGLVPVCAMKVNRDFEGGDLRLEDPVEPCTCRYESIVDTTSCATCDGGTPCITGTCRNGFCEEH